MKCSGGRMRFFRTPPGWSRCLRPPGEAWASGHATSLAGGRFGGLGLPLVEQLADVAIGEVEVGELVPEVDRFLPLLGVGAALGELEEQLLARSVLAAGKVPQRLLEVALGQPPVVATLEAVPQVEQRAPQ